MADKDQKLYIFIVLQFFRLKIFLKAHSRLLKTLKIYRRLYL